MDTDTQEPTQDVTTAVLADSDATPEPEPTPDPVGREAARYRTRLREVEAERDQLRADVDAATATHATTLAEIEEAHRVALEDAHTRLAALQRDRVLDLAERPFDSVHDPRGSWELVHPELLTLLGGFDPATAIREDGTIDAQAIDAAKLAMFRTNLALFRRVGPTSEQVHDLVAASVYAHTLPTSSAPHSPDALFNALRGLSQRVDVGHMGSID